MITIDADLDISLSRFNKNLEDAQLQLDRNVMTSMVPYMPMNTGSFINLTRARSEALAGTGVVIAGVPPMGQYLYYGKKMVDSITGKGPAKIPIDDGGDFIFRYRKGAKLVPTSEPLNYDTSTNPNAGPKWFEVAKKNHAKQWIKDVKKTAGRE